MRFCYVDETGFDGKSATSVMVGVICDAQRLSRAQTDLGELFSASEFALLREVKGKDLHLALGYSHPVVYPIPAGLEIEVDKNYTMTVRGANKQQVEQFVRLICPYRIAQATGIAGGREPFEGDLHVLHDRTYLLEVAKLFACQP